MDDAKSKAAEEIEIARRRIAQGNSIAADDALVQALKLLGIKADHKLSYSPL